MTFTPLYPAEFADLTEDSTLRGFRATALYLDDGDQPFGARLVHKRTGFTVDLLRIQSVPQAFTWVNSAPDSDRGEPHTQEHLLLLKGNMGRGLAASESKALTRSSAFTLQLQTCYHFHTNAGLDVFYKQFEHQLDALLHPDYTDEEIRREVRNFGVSAAPVTGTLRLEEKGTVYNEMVSSAASPGRALYRHLSRTLYGPAHPLSFDSGGDPAGIREMRPEHIRAFHQSHYFLANMGSILALPDGEKLDATLTRLDAILVRLQPATDSRKALTDASFPAPQPAPAGDVQRVDFPSQNEQQPSYIGLSWPADRKLSVRECLLLELFLDSFAGDPSTNLYRLFVDSRTRKSTLGAQSVGARVDDTQGYPIAIHFSQVPAANLTVERVREARRLVLEELEHIRTLADNSPELLELNARVRARITEERRDLAKLVNSPPSFGARNTYAQWFDHLRRLNREPGFEKRVTQKDSLASLDQMLSTGRNVWRDRIRDWRLATVEPYGVAVHPSSALLKQQLKERQERSVAETARLVSLYKAATPQEAIARYQKEYDAQTAQLDQLARKASASGRFLDNPPLTLDDQIHYSATRRKADVQMIASTFDNMTGATTALALRLDPVADDDLVLVSLLPALLTRSGVIDNGKPIPYEEMSELLRKQILGLQAGFISNPVTGRVELLLQGSGNDLAESRRAIEWMRLVLEHPDWRAENLPRLRDLVNQSLAQLRATSQGREEAWVRDPANAYRWQANPLFLTTSAFLTRAHNADRLRWMLTDAGTDADRTALSAFLTSLAKPPATRAEMKSLATDLAAGKGTETLPAAAQRVAKDAGANLVQLLPDLPDGSLAADWTYLCNRMRLDLESGPERTLARLNAVREVLLTPSTARLWLVGSRLNQQHLEAQIDALVGGLHEPPLKTRRFPTGRPIDARLRQHEPAATEPRFVGLLAPNLTGGVMVNLLPFTAYRDTDPESLLRTLAAMTFTGGGAHSVFTKTVGAGLAYSNGILANQRQAVAGYYAERMPEIPQTLHFAIDVVKKGPRDASLVEHAIAQLFLDTFSASSYELRAQAIADDLTDGITPVQVKRFRQAILDLRKDPELANKVFSRIDSVYGKILPGYGPKAKESPEAVYFILGNEKQFSALDADTWAREDQHVYRLYPRDFWLAPASVQ